MAELAGCYKSEVARQETCTTAPENGMRRNMQNYNRPREHHLGILWLIKFEAMGREENRPKYDRTDRTIFINIDHPQLVAARGNGDLEEPNFRIDRVSRRSRAFCSGSVPGPEKD
jgi:hypothetical protein